MKNLVFSNRISIFFISAVPIATVAILISSNNLKVKGIITGLLGGLYTHSIISVSKNKLIHAKFIQNKLDSSILEQQHLKDQLVNANKTNEELENSYTGRLEYQLGLVKGEFEEKINKKKDEYTDLQHNYWKVCKINKKHQEKQEELDNLISRYKDLNKQTDDFKLELDNREIELGNKELEMKKHHLQYDVKIDQAKRDLESNFVRIQELETAYKQVFTIANNQEKLLSLAGVGQKVSFESYLLNNILDVFVQFEIQLQVTSINNKNNSIEYKFFLADITNLAKCNSKELLAALNNRISYQITITENKDNQLTILLSTVNQSRKVEPIKLQRDTDISIPPKYDNWILDIFKKSCHELIIGSTGSGKSTFIDNLINLADYNFGGNAEIFILDPKYPYTDWTTFTPQYRGLQVIDELPGFKTCIDGLNDMLAVLKDRLKADTIAVDKGLPRNNFKPQIWVLDELLMVKDADSKLYQRAVETISRVGRGMGIRIMMLSQESNVLKNGLSVAGLQNFTRYYLGEAWKIESVREREIKVKDDREKVTNQLIEITNQNIKYYALVCGDETTPTVGVLPKPGEFSGGFGATHTHTNTTNTQPLEPLQNKRSLGTSTHQPQPETTQKSGDIQCVHCGGLNTRKNGTRNTKSGMIQRYKCHSCNKTFSVPIDSLASV